MADEVGEVTRHEEHVIEESVPAPADAPAPGDVVAGATEDAGNVAAAAAMETAQAVRRLEEQADAEWRAEVLSHLRETRDTTRTLLERLTAAPSSSASETVAEAEREAEAAAERAAALPAAALETVVQAPPADESQGDRREARKRPRSRLFSKRR